MHSIDFNQVNSWAKVWKFEAENIKKLEAQKRNRNHHFLDFW